MPVKFKPLPPLKEVRKILSYCPSTGQITRKSTGRAITTKTHDGYLYVTFDYQHWAAHRLAWLLQTGEDPGNEYIDHLDGSKDNNKFSNLRLVDASGNASNAPSGNPNKFGVKGLTWDKQVRKWYGKICHKTVFYYTPRCTDKAEAIARLLSLRMKLHGEFARHD